MQVGTAKPIDITRVHLFAPITKFVDQPDGSLVITGLMMTEALDSQNEITTYEGAKKAALAWQGNIREMHKMEAVGRAIEVIPNDEERHIFLRARISAGAPNTITKIKDGTLTGFSIGGKVNEKGRVGVRVTPEIATQYKLPSEKVGKAITMLHDWEEDECSVVDKSANGECRIDVVKAIGGVLTISDVIAKGEMEAFTEGATATPNEAPEEPTAPMEDEKQIVACLLAARRHLEAAAKLEIDEIEENGSACLDTITGCINAIRGVEKMKIMQGAAETAGTSVMPLTPQAAMDNMVAMAAKIDGVRKGMMTYKIDPKEAKALKAMMDQLDEMKASIQSFIDSNAADVKGGDKGEESPEPGESAPKPDAPAGGAPPPPPPNATQKMDMNGDAGGEAEKCNEPMGKASPTGDVQKAAAAAEDRVLKALTDLKESFEKRLSDTEAIVNKVAKSATEGGPIRSAMAVEKTIAGFPVAKSAAGIDAALSSAYANFQQKTGRIPTEMDLRRELAMEETKAAQMRRQ